MQSYASYLALLSCATERAEAEAGVATREGGGGLKETPPIRAADDSMRQGGGNDETRGEKQDSRSSSLGKKGAESAARGSGDQGQVAS